MEIENQTPKFPKFVYTKNSNKMHREILAIISKIKSVWTGLIGLMTGPMANLCQRSNEILCFVFYAEFLYYLIYYCFSRTLIH
jgi:hypothetical protein